MSLGPGETHLSELNSELMHAGLPTDLKHLIDRRYRFEAVEGSHHMTLAGSIVAIQVSDESGLVLYVSSPTLRGDKLLYIAFSNKRWLARTQHVLYPGHSTGKQIDTPGKLTLI